MSQKKYYIFFMIFLLVFAGVLAYVAAGTEFFKDLRQKNVHVDYPVDVIALKAQNNRYLDQGADLDVKEKAQIQKSVQKPKRKYDNREMLFFSKLSPYSRRLMSEPKLSFSAEKFGPPAPAKDKPKKIDNVTKNEIVIEKKQIAVAVPHSNSAPQIVIIIDDMGVSSHSTEVENLPGPLTLSYLPYATNLDKHAQRALQNGHELMLHMPMEPLAASNDGGPGVLQVGQDAQEFSRILNWGLNSFQGFVGVNNHMGSKLTKDRSSMRKVMAALAPRDLYFVDSKTIGSSVAADEAAKAGLRYAVRDVFLDHEINRAFIEGALSDLERIARKKGYAIAIGHPHSETISALEKWLPTLEGKGFRLSPASAVVRQDNLAVGEFAHNGHDRPGALKSGAQ